MDMNTLKNILDQVAKGQTSVEMAADTLKHLSFQDIDFAHIDHHRSLRKGFPEVIFGQGKTVDQINGILEKMVVHENIVLVTRVTRDKAEKILPLFPQADFHEDAGMIIVSQQKVQDKGRGKIVILSAGTSDMPVAKEAFLTAKYMGNDVALIVDIGVAGIHRLFNYKETIQNASVLVVVAGMEGALPSVVAGMVEKPVIAVPTSIGYGSNFGGLTPLLAMLNSCSSNVAVVNIDNGFGAGYMAATINRI